MSDCGRSAYLGKWRPVVAAMALCGQSPIQIGCLLYAAGVMPPESKWEDNRWEVNWFKQQRREESIAAAVQKLVASWAIIAPTQKRSTKPPKFTAKPRRRKTPERYEWTAESNWAEIEAHRGFGP